MALRVGVTGHRPNRLPNPLPEAVDQEIRRVLTCLGDGALGLLQAETALYADEPAELRLYSSLAEGSDRLAARAALDLGYVVSAALPFPREVYREDFAAPGSAAEFDALLGQARAVFELDGSREAPERAYESAGLMTVRQSDVLLALWDGGDPAGRGGTIDIVRAAVAAGVPVVWIDPAHPTARLLARTGEAGGADARDLLKSAPALDDAALVKLAWELLRPPAAPAERDAHHLKGKAHHHRKETLAARSAAAERRARRALETFLSEPEIPPSRFAGSYRLLLILTRAGKVIPDRRPYRDKAAERWIDYASALGPYADRTPAMTDCRLFQAFAWTDALASRYGDLHRDAAVRNFALAALAVFLAAAAVFDPHHAIKPWLVIGEIAVLLFIVWRTVVGIKGRWHERWADYRDLGERLRLLRVLALTGSARVPSPGYGAELFGQPAPSWTGWYYAAILREVELPNVVADRGYLRASLDALKVSEIDDQIAYHHRNERRMERVDLALEGVGLVSLAGVLLIGAFYLVAVFVDHHLMELVVPPHWEGHEFLPAVVSFIAGLFPAIGASCLGIRETGEFRRRRDLSRVMVDRLRRLRVRTRPVRRDPSLAEVAGLSETAAEAMTAEVGDWSFLFRTKPLGLPG